MYACTFIEACAYVCTRKRMYMWFDRRLSLRQVHQEGSTISIVARRSLLVGPEIFVQAPEADVHRFYYSMASKTSRKKMVGLHALQCFDA